MRKFAVSNIAWTCHDDPAILALLQKYGVAGIEVAPSKIWPQWTGASQASAAEYRKRLADRGFCIPAMQSLLFGIPDLSVFDGSSHGRFLEHMKLVAEIAEGLGAEVLVFGSPKNRRRGGLSYLRAGETAVPFFRKLGTICHDHGCVLGIEANPAEYCCDFLTNTADVDEFVRLVDSEGVKLHFDAGAAKINGENIADSLNSVAGLCHFHISEPQLAPAGADPEFFGAAFAALKKRQYPHWVSIEMRQGDPEYEILERSLQTVSEELGHVRF